MEEKNEKQLSWLMIALIAFNFVWGLGNVVNNFAQQGIVVITSWLIILVIYFIPYSLMVGQLGSTFQDSEGGVSDWIKHTSTKKLAYFAAWTFWVVQIPYLAQKPQTILIALGWVFQGHSGGRTSDSATCYGLPSILSFHPLCFNERNSGIEILRNNCGECDVCHVYFVHPISRGCSTH